VLSDWLIAACTRVLGYVILPIGLLTLIWLFIRALGSWDY
jgi:hypothetical protein